MTDLKNNPLIRAAYDALRGAPPTPSTVMVPHTVRALREFWRRHQEKLYAVPSALYEELDVLIRADEQRRILEAGGVVALADRYDAVVGENARLTRQMASRHALGTCPHCEHPERPRPVPMLVLALVFAFSGALVMHVVALLAHGAALWD